MIDNNLSTKLTDFLSSNDINRYSRYNFREAVFARIFNRTICYLLEEPIFPKGKENWIDESRKVIEEYNNNVHYSTKMAPMKASKISNASEFYGNIKDKRKKQNSK